MRDLVRGIFAAAVVVVLQAPTGLDAAESPPWPQASSDIPADPAVTFGALPNGMRYAIMKNATPKGEVSIRLRIGAGSLMESDAQQGLAHFLEHMAFRGSAHVPEGNVFEMLQKLGLRTGADANAQTGQTDTVFQFDLPQTDDATIDQGLMLTRDILSELSLKPEAFDAERGPVLSEERLRAGPGERAFETQSKFLLKGQLAPERIPIGKVDIIRNAPVSLVRDFYRDYYRPQRAALIVVGDIDPAAIKAKIEANFADWNPPGLGGRDPDLGTPAMRGKEFEVFSEPGAPQSISIAWVQAYDGAPDTAARRRHNLIDSVALSILNQRFATVAQNDDAPFTSAGASRGNSARSAKITSLRIGYVSDKWQRALEEAEKIRRQMVLQGVSQQELDREVKAILADTDADLEASATRQSRNLARGLVSSIDRNYVFSSPETDAAVLRRNIQGISVEDVNGALRDVFAGNGPLVFLSSSSAVEGGKAALASVFDRAEVAPVENTTPPQVADWPYTSFGAPGQVVETRHIEDLDTYFVRFANGVRLTVKPTKFRANQILVSANIAGGDLAFPKDHTVLDPAAYLSGGLKALSFLDMRRTLEGKVASVGFGIDDDSFSLSGNTRPEDLDTELQLIAAYITAPGWRPEPYHKSLSSLLDYLPKLDISPMSLFNAKFSELLHPGDARWAYPTSADVAAATLDQVKAVISPALLNNAIEVTMVGDVSLGQAIKSVSETLGALPGRADMRPQPPQPGDVRFPAPTPQPVVLYHSGRPDQGAAAIAWQTTDLYADDESAARGMLKEILQLRMLDELRIRDGATYSPSAAASASRTFPGYGYIAAFAEIPPDKSQLFFDTVQRIAADLRDHGPSQEYFERAHKPAVDAMEKAVETNNFWASSLIGAQSDERRLTYIRDLMPQLQAVTPADVQRVARKYLRDDRAWKLIIEPKPGADKAG